MRRMKKKLLAIPFALAFMLGIASCGSESSTTETKTTTVTTTATTTLAKETYTLKVYDLDGELIGEKVVDYQAYPTVLAGLEANFTVDVDGSWLKRIDGTVIDSNYYLSITQNGEYASVGVNELDAKPGDVIEFRNICWKDFDSYDQLVDKAIYNYAKNGLKNTLSGASTYQNDTYWQTMALNLMMKNGYDSYYFNNNLPSKDFKESIMNQDYSTLASYPADFAKWYYGYRLYEATAPEGYLTAYTTYLEGLTEYSSWDEYTLPFTLSIAKELNLDSKISSSVKATAYRPDNSFGTDGLAWFLTGYSLYQDYAEDELSNLDSTYIDNAVELGYASADVSISQVILALVAGNHKVREVIYKDNKDILAYLLDTYFDEETYQFDIEKSENDYSSNQIYAALMAYKVARDTNQGVILFA